MVRRYQSLENRRSVEGVSGVEPDAVAIVQKIWGEKVGLNDSFKQSETGTAR